MIVGNVNSRHLILALLVKNILDPYEEDNDNHQEKEGAVWSYSKGQMLRRHGPRQELEKLDYSIMKTSRVLLQNRISKS
ncbi:hypothetical protein MA16_Dca019546 [Dendrobium catenatum]|uniref:Uncharacterized protein n=1 Tax=Dendrobium catenatum TaxID=906689 RepID=A0A2I0XAG8_9ASPA|nr:hypothetical protein MA16_Dca019546 [Dendrobium catenatum]